MKMRQIKKGIGVGFRWVSVLDLRTTFVCASRNGKINKRRGDFEGLPPIYLKTCKRIGC